LSRRDPADDAPGALTHPYLARAFCEVGDGLAPAPGQAKKAAMLGSLDLTTQEWRGEPLESLKTDSGKWQSDGSGRAGC